MRIERPLITSYMIGFGLVFGAGCATLALLSMMEIATWLTSQN